MRFPLGLTLAVSRYMFQQSRRRAQRYPTVLMLEPLYTCNLACIGCSTERHTGKLKDRLSVEACLESVDQAGAPTMSLCGGEPTLYPELPELLAGLIQRQKYIYLCTNALLLDQKVFDVIQPDPHLIINVHLDGLQATHDYVCDRAGVFDKALEMVGEAKRRGYYTMTNTTVYQETPMSEVEELCELLMARNVDGMLISPGYQYASVERDIFMKQQDIHRKFARVMTLSKYYPLTATPAFLEFCAGQRQLNCAPYSTVTRTPLGWKAPCYLIDDHYYPTWEEFWNSVDWAYWETRQDDKCQNCYMHSGFEASAVKAASGNFKDFLNLMLWNLRKPSGQVKPPAAPPEEPQLAAAAGD
ncbi:MAG: adenosyl-hopene transferase HpnH [Fimbriimonadaceae bacterium]|nr:adenosyl-hopene transferase HpnH [Fimbriimonadaceae bacterium]